MIIAIDAMGGDKGISVVVEGLAQALAQYSDVEFLLFGDEKKIAHEIKIARAKLAPERYRIHHTSENIEMTDKLDALRHKRDSSIARSTEAVKSGEAQGVVAIGSTMAAVACATLILRTLPGVKRPGIAVPMPNPQGFTILCDAGASVNPKPEHLLSYGLMASLHSQLVLGKANPRVGLLNVGEERGKGSEFINEVFELLTKADVNFVGNAEGRQIFTGEFDVVVTDGFTGNIVLKTAEGTAELMRDIIKEELTRNLVRAVAAKVAQPAFTALKKRTDYSEAGGGVLLGVRGVVTIGHGRSDGRAVFNAIRVTREAIKAGLIEKITQAVEQVKPLTQPSAAS
ncbi:MAG: phosphate acyltransferase PlsX [Planctomycetota bacterium]